MEIDGYIAATPYPPHLPAPFAPAWMDHALRHGGWRPNRGERGPFKYLDVGCGNGLHLILFAACHPEARFVGTDADSRAIDRAAAIASGLGVANAEFRSETFAETLAAGESGFDYVAALGVLSWVSAENRAAVIRIAGAALAPGGVAGFGYNCLPGRSAELLPQRIILEEAKRGGAQPAAVARAMDLLAGLVDAGADALRGTRVENMLKARAELDPDFLPHEYLSEHWTPLHSADVIRAAEQEGLAFASSLTPVEMRPDFFLRSALREIVERAPTAAERARLTDLAINQSFRRDLFVKSAEPGVDLSGDRMAAWFAARIDADAAAYGLDTPAGRLKFDNAAARAIMRGLQDGPKPIAALEVPGTRADCLNAVDALLAATLIEPVDPPAKIDADALNAWTVERFAAGVATVSAQATPFGVRRLDRGLMDALARGSAPERDLRRLGIEPV